MFENDEKKFLHHTGGLFPPEKSNLTLHEDMLHTITSMRETIDRLMKFEVRVENKVSDLMSKLTSDNVLFKDTFNNAYKLFLQEVKNEVNLFESNVDNTVKLFGDNLKTDYENLDTEMQGLITENLKTYDEKLKEFETTIFNSFKEKVESMILNNANSNAEISADFQRKLTTELNMFEADVNTAIRGFTTSITEKFDTFKTTWTEIVENRLDEQDRKLANTENYMKTNLEATVRTELGDMYDSGDFAEILEGEVFNSIQEKMETLENNLESDMKENLAQTETKMNEVSRRMDNIVATNDTATDGNAELLDIRVGADGVTYPTAGTSVREQLKKKADNERIERIENFINNGCNFKYTESVEKNKSFQYVDEKTVNIIDSEMATSLTDYIDISDTKNIVLSAFSITGTHSVTYVLYDKNKAIIHVGCPLSDNTIIDEEQAFIQDYNFILPENAKYIRVAFFQNDLITWEHPFIKFDVKNKKTKSAKPYTAREVFDIPINKKIADVTAKSIYLQDFEQTYIDKGIIWLPYNYDKDGEPVRLIISCHGSGQTMTDTTDLNQKPWDFFLLNMGYAILDVNGGVEDGRHFGASWAIDSYVKAYQYVIEKYNLHKEVFVIGASMGGLTSFGIVQSGRIPVLAQAGFSPVTDLYRQAWSHPWFSEHGDFSIQRKRIAEYYNFNNHSTFENWSTSQTPNENEMQYFLDNIDKVGGFNPMTNKSVNYKTAGIYNISTVKSEWENNYNDLIKTHNTPLKIWHAEDDTIVESFYSKAIVHAINNAGGQAYIREYTEGGHDMDYGVHVNVTDIRNKEWSVPTNFLECYYWFKRFE